MPAIQDDDYYHQPSTNIQHHSLHKDMLNGLLRAPSRSHTPSLSNKLRVGNGLSQSTGNLGLDQDPTPEDDPLILKFKSLYDQAELRIADLFDRSGHVVARQRKGANQVADATEPLPVESDATAGNSNLHQPITTSKKRKLDDDYDDYDDDDDEEDDVAAASPLKAKSSKVQIIADRNASPVPRPVVSTTSSSNKTDTNPRQPEKPEDARKKLEEAKRVEVETVKSMSRQYFFTLENDRDAMLDQQRLDEAERRAEAEAEGNAKNQNAAQQQGSLSNANLGASSLTLKNLIARIDQRRSVVQASESELRALMSEVRKNRSKWASEEKVGQEELYEAAEKVLNELKAQTEHSSPFLQPVKKKDAPDYHNIIKAPMDLGTMTKKLKQLAYKSKQEFCDELHLIWTNCLRYNSALDHPMRKHALFMRKETDKLVPLIPEIIIRDRAEIEAEERKQQIANGELDDNAEDSDDDQPIMASRGRAAPGSKKTSKTTQNSRNLEAEVTPNPEPKPSSMANLNNLPNGGQADSEVDFGSQGNSTPPPGNLTPSLDKTAGSVIDAGSEMPDSEVPALPFTPFAPEAEDEEYRLWKQKTKKERAMIAAARHRLFRGDKLNVEEEALLRSKSSMRRWQRLQGDSTQELALADTNAAKGDSAQRGPTLAEGLEPEEEESMLPDYYDPLGAVPDLDTQLRWENDAEGNVIEQNGDYLRLYPGGRFVAPPSRMALKLADNMKQIQETRKIVSKIGVVKQMQLQTQLYQNQFTKFEPAPFFEADISNHVMTDDGPLMAPWVSKAAFSRSIGEIFFHAGFEEFQPTAMEVVTDMAADFFQNLCSNLSAYLTQDKVPVVSTVTVPTSSKGAAVQLQASTDSSRTMRPAMTSEEALLHTLNTAGMSLNDLHYYAHDEMDRMSARVQTMYDRMRAHYAELLKPAVTDDTATGSGSFETGEQYVGGDFADDLGEDFFGFKELGLDREFGLVNLSVPLHLLHNRLSTAAQKNNDSGNAEEKQFLPPAPYARVNVENVESEIGLVREFFKKRLKENGDRPLPEDQELPVKQRKGYGKARVPATGKIGDGKVGASPQKKAPPTKADNKAVTKIALTNGNKDDKRRDSSASNANLDTSMMDLDAPDGSGPPSPGRSADVEGSQINGIAGKQKPLSKPPTKQRPGDARKTSQARMNGAVTSQDAEAEAGNEDDDTANFDTFVNGIDSPPPSAHGNEPSSEKKKPTKLKKPAGKAGRADGPNSAGGMISPQVSPPST